jgi:hypothetical protein
VLVDPGVDHAEIEVDVLHPGVADLRTPSGRICSERVRQRVARLERRKERRHLLGRGYAFGRLRFHRGKLHQGSGVVVTSSRACAHL